MTLLYMYNTIILLFFIVMDIDSDKGTSSIDRKEGLEQELERANENGVTEEMEVSEEGEKKTEDHTEDGQRRVNGVTEHSDSESVNGMDRSKEEESSGGDSNEKEEQPVGSTEPVGTFMGALNLLPAKRNAEEMDEENGNERDKEQKGQVR